MKLELLIIDANVLIDFYKTDRTVLALVAKQYPLHRPGPSTGRLEVAGYRA